MMGRVEFGEVKVYFTSVEHLQTLYIGKNQFIDKHWSVRLTFAQLIPNSIFFQSSNDESYAIKRKALSGAFYKSRLIGMTKIIK